MYVSPHHRISNNNQTHWWAVSDSFAFEFVSCIESKPRAQQPLVMSFQRDQESQHVKSESPPCLTESIPD